MRKFLVLFLLAVIFVSVLPLTVYATSITSQGDLSPLDTVIDFESVSLGFTSNPLSLSGATFSSGSTLQIIDNTFDAAINFPTFTQGHFLASPGTVNGSGQASVPIEITFIQPIAEIGIGFFDPNFSGNFLKVYNSSNILLESVESFTGPVGGSFADFIGIQRSSNEIARVEIVAAPNDFLGIDNVTFGRVSASAPIPEPSTMLLFGTGIVGLIGWQYRKNQRK